MWRPSGEAAEGAVEESSVEEAASPLDRFSREALDRAARMGRGARNMIDRVMASKGKLKAVMPRFVRPRMGVRNAGIMTSFVAMKKLGILDDVEKFLPIPNGQCSGKLIVMAQTSFHLLRKTPAQVLKHGTPAELGAAFGIDRLPCIETFREKIKALSKDLSRVKGWCNEMSRRWWREFGDDFDRVINLDKHYKICSTRRARIPRLFLNSKKCCLPALSRVWANLLGGVPLFCAVLELNKGLCRCIREHVVPKLRDELGILPPDAPNLHLRRGRGRQVRREPEGAEGRETGRDEGAGRGGRGQARPHDGLRPRGMEPEPVQVAGRARDRDNLLVQGRRGPGLAGRRIQENARSDLRPIRLHRLERVSRRREEGRAVRCGRGGRAQVQGRAQGEGQRPRRATDRGGFRRGSRDTSAEGRRPPGQVRHDGLGIDLVRIAGALFSRWSQENFFKYAEREFDLGRLTVHQLEDVDPETIVPNPRRNRIGSELAKMRKLAKSQRRAEKTLRKAVEAGKDRAAKKRGAAKKSAAERKREAEERRDALCRLRKLLGEIAINDREIAEKELELKAEPTHVPAGALSEKERPKYIRENENMFVDQTKTAAYQIETWMMQFFEPMGHGQRPRTVLKALFEADADIMPEPEKGILRVRILGMPSKAMDKAVVPLLEALNRTETKFPDTNLRLVYELPEWGET